MSGVYAQVRAPVAGSGNGYSERKNKGTECDLDTAAITVFEIAQSFHSYAVSNEPESGYHFLLI